MRPSGMYYKGWHFAIQDKYAVGNPTTSHTRVKWAPYLPRCLASPPYMLIDFGVSTYHKPGWPPYHIGIYGTYTPPEMHENSVCNAYHVDIWCFGNTIRSLIEVSFFGLPFPDLIPPRESTAV
jgi:hypothetical protein